MDAELRSQENLTRLDPSPEKRSSLLTSMVRSGRGQILWWPCQKLPHPSAARVRFTSSFENELTKQSGTHSMTGWAVAVASPLDLIRLGQTHRTGTLIDLESGSWVRVLGSPVQREIANVEAEAATVDALGRARTAGTPTGLQTRGDAAVQNHRDQIWPEEWAQLPSGSVVRRARSEPLFDTVVISSMIEARAFVTLHSFSEPVNGIQVKQWGVHTNIMSSGGGHLPQGQQAAIYGISVEILDQQMRPLPRNFVREIVGRVGVSFNVMQTTISSMLLSQLVLEAAEDHADLIEIPCQPPPMFVFAFPVVLDALQQFDVRLICSQGQIPSMNGEPILARVILHARVSKGFVD